MTRIVTWTLGVDADAAGAGAALSALRPDVVLLGDQPASGRSLKRLASRAGLTVASRAGRGRSGSAVLVADGVRVRTTSSLDLPGAGTARKAAHAILSVGGRVLSVLAFRLGADPDGRLADARAVVAFMDTVEHLDVAGGDLGESAGGPALAAMLEGRVDAYALAGAGAGAGDTYPTPEPLSRHDVIVVDEALPISAAAVGVGPDMDRVARHRPVVVDLEDET